jgi:hypothetical protein
MDFLGEIQVTMDETIRLEFIGWAVGFPLYHLH